MAAPKLDGRLGQMPNDAAFTIGAEAGNIIKVSVQLLQGADAITNKCHVIAYISSDAAGDVPVATADAVAIATDGTIVSTPTALQTFIVRSEANGKFDLNITEASVVSYYLTLILPNGESITSPVIAFA